MSIIITTVRSAIATSIITTMMRSAIAMRIIITTVRSAIATSIITTMPTRCSRASGPRRHVPSLRKSLPLRWQPLIAVNTVPSFAPREFSPRRGRGGFILIMFRANVISARALPT